MPLAPDLPEVEIGKPEKSYVSAFFQTFLAAQVDETATFCELLDRCMIALHPTDLACIVKTASRDFVPHYARPC